MIKRWKDCSPSATSMHFTSKDPPPLPPHHSASVNALKFRGHIHNPLLLLISWTYFIFSADNWTFYKDYLSAALKCQSLEDCLKLLDETAAVAGKNSRAPQLARLELLKTARESQIECLFSHVEDMHKYFNKFGSKGCVINDLKMYLHLLSTPEKDLLLEKVKTKDNSQKYMIL